MPCKTRLNFKLYSVCSNHLDKAQNIVTIEDMENYEFDLKDANVKIPKRATGNAIKSNKCNQCDYESSHAGNLRTHLTTHSGEKPNKCNQCDFASYHASNLRTHLKTHSGEKPNKRNQCDF